MNDMITNILGMGTAMSPIVMMLVEAVKRSQVVSSKFMPYIAMGLGALFGVALFYTAPGQFNIGQLILAGIASGGMASGLYNAVQGSTTQQ